MLERKLSVVFDCPAKALSGVQLTQSIIVSAQNWCRNHKFCQTSLTAAWLGF